LKHTEDTIIKATPATVFAYLSDVRNRSDYIPMLEDIILLDEGPIQVGARYIEVAKIAGRHLKTTYQVMEMEQDKKIRVQTLESVFPIEVVIDLIEKGDQTQVQLSLDFELKGLYKLGAPVVKGIVEQQAKDVLRRLKGRLEKA
jgi:carbon monoxide dehydrogenase subunit G